MQIISTADWRTVIQILHIIRELNGLPEVLYQTRSLQQLQALAHPRSQNLSQLQQPSLQWVDELRIGAVTFQLLIDVGICDARRIPRLLPREIGIPRRRHRSGGGEG